MSTNTKRYNPRLVHVESAFRSRVKRFRRYGSRARGVCPIHPKAKNQNLSMDLNRGLAHCFSCGWSGDVIDFVKAVDGVDFLEAAERLHALEPVDDAQAVLMRQERAAKQRAEQAKKDAWADHLNRMAKEMETDERIYGWALQYGHDDVAKLAAQSIEITGVDCIMAKLEALDGSR